MSRLLLLCLVWGWSTLAWAQQSQEIQIEVLVFAFADARVSPSSGALPDYGRNSLTPPMPAAGERLGTAWQRLRNDPATAPLLRLSWRQGLYEQQWIRLDGREAGFDGRLLLKPGKPLSLSVEADYSGASGSFSLRQTRSTHFGENQYLDHRGFGLIVRVDAISVDPATIE